MKVMRTQFHRAIDQRGESRRLHIADNPSGTPQAPCSGLNECNALFSRIEIAIALHKAISGL